MVPHIQKKTKKSPPKYTKKTWFQQKFTQTLPLLLGQKFTSYDNVTTKKYHNKKKRYVVVVFCIYKVFRNRIGTWLNVNVYFTTTILYTTLEHSTYYRISKYKKIIIYLCFDIRTSCFVHVVNCWYKKMRLFFVKKPLEKNGCLRHIWLRDKKKLNGIHVFSNVAFNHHVPT